MRYSIRQTNPQGELWLIRTTKKGVWGAQERAYGFFRRPTAARWAARLGATNPGLILEIVEMEKRGLVAAIGALTVDEAPAADADAAVEVDDEFSPVAMPA